jgi:hypothetical protein
MRPAVVRAYDWSQVQASHQTSVMVGANASLMHHLMFTVHDAQGNIVDEYGISHIIQPVPMVWSYIHGYMQGRIDPKPEDVRPGDGEVVGYWDIIQELCPYLAPSTFLQHLKDLPKLTIACCVFAPLVWAWLVVYLVTKFLADLTEQELLWPQSILDALGPDISSYDPSHGPAPLKCYQRKATKG